MIRLDLSEDQYFQLRFALELAHHRAQMWQEFIDNGDCQLNEFHESSMEEACQMADATQVAVETANLATRRPGGVEIIEIKRNIDLVMIRDTNGKIKYRSKRDFTRQQMLDHSVMRCAEGGAQS